MSNQRRTLATGLIVVGAATLIGNGAGYLLSMIAARALIPAQFGALGALLAILVIIATLGISMQTLTARRVAVAGAEATAAKQAEAEGHAVRLASYIGAAIFLGAIVACWPLGTLFSIPVLAVFLGIASIAFVVIGSAAMGISQGREQHLRLSVGFIANGGLRALFGIAGVVALQSVDGAALGIAVGCAAGALVSYWICCPRTWSSSIGRGGAAEFGHIAHALLVLFTLTNVDVLMARLFLSNSLSGEYSVGVLLAKIAFFLPNAIIIVLFPKMTSGNARRTVLLATALTAIMGALITVFSGAFGEIVVKILGGKQYAGQLESDVWLFALEGAAFALVQVLLYARLAAQDKRAAISVWVALGILVAAVSLWRHGSVAQIVTTVVAVSLGLTAVGLILDYRHGTGGELEPIEMVE